MKKWFRKHRHGVQTTFEIIMPVILFAELTMGMYKTYLRGKQGFAPVYAEVIFWGLFVLFFVCFVIATKLQKYNRKRDKIKIHTHNIAAMMIDEFEEVLDYHNITIPDEAREGGKDEARIYGETYDKLLTNIELMVIATLSVCCNERDVELVTDKFE